MPSKQPLSEAPARRWMALLAWLRAKPGGKRCNFIGRRHEIASYFVFFIDLLRKLLALN